MAEMNWLKCTVDGLGVSIRIIQYNNILKTIIGSIENYLSSWMLLDENVETLCVHC